MNRTLNNNDMKRFRLLLVAVSISALFVSCDGNNSGSATLPNIIGKPYEVMVVSSEDLWKSSVGDTVKAIFGQEAEMLNIPEPLYDVINVTPQQINVTLKRHRNVLILTVDDQKYKKTTIDVTPDKIAKDQVTVEITSPSIDSMTNYVWINRDELLGFFDKSERDRYMSKALKYRNEQIGTLIKDKFGFTMNVPSMYTVRSDKPNFLWISYELPLSSLGLTIYTFDPITDTLALITARDEAVHNIPGPSDGSFMKSDTTFMPTFKVAEIDGRDWFEMRGFWNVKGDFMGGPFANYTTSDPVSGKMIGIDCYVLSNVPRNGMRNYMRQLEAIVSTVKFNSVK